MKKTLLAASVGLITFSGAIFVGTATLAHAQSITLTQLVQLFIQLGIIPSDKAAAAEAAVANMSSGNATTSGYTTTTVIATTTMNAVPVVSVLGSPNILSSQSPYQNGSSTTTLQSTFYVQIQAIGDNFYFQPASAEPFDFSISRNGVWSDMSAYSHVVSFSVPPAGVITAGLPSDVAFELQQNNRIQLPITFSFLPVGSLSTYKISLTGVKFINSGGNVQTTTAIKGVATQGFTSSGVTQTNTQPDLTITNVSFSPASPQINNYITTNVTVVNDSSVAVNVPFSVNVEGIVETVPSLAAGAQTIVTIPAKWTFSSPGTYTVNALVDWENAANESNTNNNLYPASITFTAAQTTQTSPTISPSNQTVSSTQTSSSGQPAVITVTTPTNTVKSQLYLSCPSGLSAKIDGFAGQACNTYLNTTGMGSSFSILFTNSTANPISAVPNFYVYLSSNPNFAVGVSANIVVNPAPQTTVQPSITITSPSGGTYQIGSSIPIRWTSSNLGSNNISVSLVKVVNGVDSGIIGAFPAIYNVSDGSVPNNGSVTWTVPSTFDAGTYKVRLNPDSVISGMVGVYADSPVFTIIAPQNTTQTNTQTNAQPSITVTSPDGSNSFSSGNYVPGGSIEVVWKESGFTPKNVQITLIGVNGQAQQTLGSLGPSSQLALNVTLPQGLASGNYHISVCDTTLQICGMSNSFVITAPQSLNLSAPISTLPISASTQTQTSSNVPFVGPVQNPTPAAPAVTSTQTSVSAPSADTNTSSQTSAQTQVQTQSAQTGPVNSISVLSPSTGETLTQGQDYTIRWSTSNLAPSVTTAYILLTNSSGSTITTIASSVPAGQGSYVWNVGSNVYPSLPAGKYKIKVALYYNNTPSALSGIFTLSAPVASAPAPQQTTSFINTLSTIGAAVIGAFHF